MSNFTRPCAVLAIPTPPTGWRRWLPPGWLRPRWQLAEGFRYAVGSLEAPTETITVPRGFVFDGASVPVPFRGLLPMAHPSYLQAAALHDWMLGAGQWPRRYADTVFREALAVLGMPPFWRDLMFAAVRIGAARAWIVSKFQRSGKDGS